MSGFPRSSGDRGGDSDERLQQARGAGSTLARRDQRIVMTGAR